MTFSPGQHVRSKPVGQAEAFPCQIVSVMPDGSFIVRDYFHRRRWLRKADELESTDDA